MEFDIEDLTLGDIEDLETFGGVNVMAGIPDQPPLKFIRAWAWITARRADPELTFEATRNIKLNELGDGGSQAPNVGGAPGDRPDSSGNSRRSSTSTAGSRRKRSGV